MNLLFKCLVLVGLLEIAGPVMAQTPVTFPLRDLTGSDQIRMITVTSLDGPISYLGTIYYGGPINLMPVPGGATNSLGQPVTGVTTNLIGGNLRITYQGLPKSSQIYVPFGFTNLISAADPAYQRAGLVQVFSYTNAAPPGALLWDDISGATGYLIFDP